MRLLCLVVKQRRMSLVGNDPLNNGFDEPFHLGAPLIDREAQYQNCSLIYDALLKCRRLLFNQQTAHVLGNIKELTNKPVSENHDIISFNGKASNSSKRCTNKFHKPGKTIKIKRPHIASTYFLLSVFLILPKLDEHL